MTTGMMSSLTDDWATPSAFFATLAHEFPFTLDVAASASNAKCERYYDIEADGLSQPWAPHVCWMNPPYGRSIGAWVEKAYHEATLGATIVGLLPARTDTAWWHDYVTKAAEVRFVRGRLKFYNRADAPFPSAVAIWRAS
jgi:site-specific DNA-methyltransferase (adenine-specific)